MRHHARKQEPAAAAAHHRPARAGPARDGACRRYRVLGPRVWEENLSSLLEDGPIDLVCFTGDAANFGEVKEFEKVTHFVRTLLERLGLPRIACSSPWVTTTSTVASMHPAGPRCGPCSAVGWIPGRRALDPVRWRSAARRGADLAARGARPTAGMARLGGRILSRPDLLPENSPHGTLGYRAALKLARSPVSGACHRARHRVALRGRPRRDELRLTDGQILALRPGKTVPRSRGCGWFSCTIPSGIWPTARRAGGSLPTTPTSCCAATCTRPSSRSGQIPIDGCRTLAAGCLYEGDRADQWPNSHQVVTLELDGSGRPVRGEARFRSWSPRGGHWFDDDGLYKGSREGGFPGTSGPAKAYRGQDRNRVVSP